MVLLGVILLFFCLERPLYFGECLAPYFFLLDWGSDRGTGLKFLSTIGVLIRYLFRIFVNYLLSYFLLLYFLNNVREHTISTSSLKCLNLRTMISRKYGQVDVDIGDAMASLKLN